MKKKISNFKIFLVSLLGTLAFTSPAYAGPVVPVIVGAVIGAGAAALGLVAGSIFTAALIGAAVGAVVGVLGGGLLGGMFDVPDYNVTANAQAENDGILVNKLGMLEHIPVVYGKRKVGGKIVYLDTQGDRNKYLYMAIVLCEGEITAIDEVYLDDILITDSKFSGRYEIQKFTGADNQGASSLLNEANAWDSNHRLKGLAYIALRLEWRKVDTQEDADANPYKGIPKVNAVIRGKKVKSAASAGAVTYENETGLAYSKNPADCLLDYLRNPRYGRGLANNRINFSSFATARTKYNETVTYVTGDTGPVLNCDAVIDTGRSLFDNVKIFLANARSGLPYVQGQFKLKLQDTGNATSSQNTTPAVTTFNTTSGDIDETIIVNGLKVTGSGIKHQFNQVKITYVDPANEWKTNEVIYPEVNGTRDLELLAEDNNRRLTKEMSFNHIIQKNQAADIAHIVLEQSRKRKFIEFTGTAELHNAEVGDIVRITYSPLAFSSVLYRIESTKLNNDYTVTITASEHTPSEYVFKDNDAIYGSRSQRVFVGDETKSNYYVWNGTDWVTVNGTIGGGPKLPTYPQPPSAPIQTSFQLSALVANPFLPGGACKFYFTMNDDDLDAIENFQLQYLNLSYNVYQRASSLIDSAYVQEVTSGTYSGKKLLDWYVSDKLLTVPGATSLQRQIFTFKLVGFYPDGSQVSSGTLSAYVEGTERQVVTYNETL